MTWRVVAGLDLRYAIRSRLLQAAAGTFVVACIVLAVGLSVAGNRLTAAGAITYVISLSEWLIPGMGLVVGYSAIVGERDARTLQHLVTASHSRLAIMAGKLAARSLVVIVPVVLGYLISAGIIWVLFPGMGTHLLGYLFFVLVSILFATTFVGVAVGLSAVSRQPVRAATGAMGSFILFVFLWDLVPAGVFYAVNGSLPGSRTPPAWYFFLVRLNPIEAYVELLTAGFSFLESELFTMTAWYLELEVMILILIAWFVAPLALGYLRFRGADIQ